MKTSGASQGQSASKLISKRIAELGDWRGGNSHLQGSPTHQGKRSRMSVEECGDVDGHSGLVALTASSAPASPTKGREAYQLRRGEFLKDPAHLFNSSLDGNVRRAIDIHEGEEVGASAFKALVRQAVALNSSGKSKRSKKAKA